MKAKAKGLKPNKRRIRKWVEALRSGKYKRATHRLRNGDKFCCLGVACDISGLGKWLDNGAYLVGRQSDWQIMPPAVWRWFGLDEGNPNIHYGVIESAGGLNDLGWSFKRIAAAIEKKYLS